LTQYSQATRLHDCTRHGDAADNELLIVEGKSASKSVLRLRQSNWQAVLPMQGKPINAAKASPARVARNGLYRVLIDSLGGGWADSFDVNQIRFRRVVLMFDPDADGIHCGVLLTMFFHRWMPELISAGKLHIVRPPLFEMRVTVSDSSAATAATVKRIFASTDLELAQRRQHFAASGGGGATVHRYRGLGSYDAEILEQTCLNPKTRSIDRITAQDVAAMQQVFGS